MKCVLAGNTKECKVPPQPTVKLPSLAPGVASAKCGAKKAAKKPKKKKPSLCWIRMPTGCHNKMSETNTPNKWFVQSESVNMDKQQCQQQLGSFNNWCKRKDATWFSGETPPNCWVRMPSGCENKMDETKTPKKWFVAPTAYSSATCEGVLGRYNSWCKKKDAIMSWARRRL